VSVLDAEPCTNVFLLIRSIVSIKIVVGFINNVMFLKCAFKVAAIISVNPTQPI
jgi:hypothetical protein